MSRVAVIFMGLGLAVFLTACGGAQQVEIDPVGSKQESVAPTPRERPKPPPVKREAKDLFRQGVKAYRPKSGKPDLSRALKLFEDAVDEDPGFGAAYFNIGRIYERRGNLDKAADYYRQASAKGKNFADGLANLGRIKLMKGKSDEAQRLFQDALQIDKYNGEALLNLAQDARARRDFANAVKRVRTALKGNEKNPKAYAVLARVYFDMGRYQLAKLVCVTGLKIDKLYPDLNNTLGLVFLKLDDVRSALGAFEAAVSADGNYTPARLNIGAITFNYRDYETSLRHFEAVVRREPKNQIALLSRAVALRGLNRLAEAEKGYKSVLTMNPENVGAHYNLGILYQEYLSKFDVAIKHLESVLQYERTNGALRKDVANRIKAIRIQIRNKKEVEDMMRRQKAEDAARAKAEKKTAVEKKSAPAKKVPKKAKAGAGKK